VKVGSTLLAHARLNQNAAQLGQRLDNQCPGHHGMSREVVRKNVIRQGDALDGAGQLRRTKRSDPVKKEVTQSVQPQKLD
jgi:hypothetical protein